MQNVDVLVIGGSAAGTVASVTGKSRYPDKEFLVIRKEEQAFVPCGIPYIFGSLGSSDENLAPTAVFKKAGVQLRIGETVSIDTGAKTCKTADGDDIAFEKLVLATGSVPLVPGWLKGADLGNVFTVPKDKTHLDGMLATLEDCNQIVVIGGGFIGVEVADELNKRGKNVTIVEILPHVLSLAFDNDLASRAEEVLTARGTTVRAGSGVKEVLGNGTVRGVLLNDGETLEADAVILCMGYRPKTELATEAGLELNPFGSIKVDEYMRTANPDVFAAGDCAEKRDFLTRKPSRLMLAATACAEARVAGMNLYKLSAVKTFAGTIGIFATALGDHAFGVAGLTESAAEKEGFDVVTGSFEGIDKHPGKLPETHKQFVKLIVARESGQVLGGQVAGGPSAGELTNLLGFIIQHHMPVSSILTAQIGTHPLLTAPPTAYPLTQAAQAALKQVKAAQ